MSETLTAEQRADGWRFAMTKEEEWDRLGYVVQDQIRFRLHCRDGNLDVVEDYLNTEKIDLVDINLPDAIGLTPLMLAAQRGHPQVVAALLEARADPKLVDKSNRSEKITALDYAKGYPHMEGDERQDPCVQVLEEFMGIGGGQ